MRIKMLYIYIYMLMCMLANMYLCINTFITASMDNQEYLKVTTATFPGTYVYISILLHVCICINNMYLHMYDYVFEHI
jgi:hypothetical protein